jgi:hypothetical protein
MFLSSVLMERLALSPKPYMEAGMDRFPPVEVLLWLIFRNQRIKSTLASLSSF